MSETSRSMTARCSKTSWSSKSSGTRSPSIRFDVTCALLRATDNCELALELCAQSEVAGHDLDRLVDAVERHAGDCAACRLELVQVLFRLLRAQIAPRTMSGRLTRL